jgi:hypothetical protein
MVAKVSFFIFILLTNPPAILATRVIKVNESLCAVVSN